MTASPLASVIVPVFNRATVVGDAVASLARQTLEDIEIIVVDDGSSDDSAEVAELAGGKRVRIVRHGTNRGIPAARNTGLEAARGKYIAWLDSDDFARPRRLERQIAFLERNPEIAMVGSSAGRIGHHHKWPKVPLLAHECLAAALLFRSPFQQSSITGRAAALKSIPYRQQFPVCEDLDMFMRISRRHRVANMSAVLIDRRMHSGQINKVQSELVRDRKRLLLGEALAELGLDPSTRDLDLHITLGAPKNQPQARDFVAWAQGWLKAVQVANARAGRYNPEALRLVCAHMWIRACHVAMHGRQRPAVLRALLASSLTLGLASSYELEWLGAALTAYLSSS